MCLTYGLGSPKPQEWHCFKYTGHSNTKLNVESTGACLMLDLLQVIVFLIPPNLRSMESL